MIIPIEQRSQVKCSIHTELGDCEIINFFRVCHIALPKIGTETGTNAENRSELVSERYRRRYIKKIKKGCFAYRISSSALELTIPVRPEFDPLVRLALLCRGGQRHEQRCHKKRKCDTFHLFMFNYFSLRMLYDTAKIKRFFNSNKFFE